MQTSPSTAASSSLIRQVKADDPDSWERLAHLYAPLVYAWCRHAGLGETDTADISQNVFIQVFKNIQGFQSRGVSHSFRRWLWKITRNEVLMHFRRRGREPRAPGGTEAQQAMKGIPDYFEENTGLTDSDTETQFVRRALEMIRNEFEERTWQAFWRTAIEDQSATDIAEELGLSPGAVRTAKYRVLKRLREFLSED